MGPDLTIENKIVAAIRRIIRAIDLQSRKLMDNCGLTGPQLIALKAAAELSTASVGTIAKAVHLSSPTLTGVLDRLEKRGLIKRLRDEHDRRSLLITVTPMGQGILDKAPSPLQDRFRLELAKLEEWEQTMMLGTLQRIASMMEAEDIDAAPVLVTGSVDAAGAFREQPNDKNDNLLSIGEAGKGVPGNNLP